MSGKQLYVTDTSAVDPSKPRVHDIILDDEVRQITFKYGEPTELPVHIAMMFNKSGFVVRDAGGKEIKKPHETKVETLSELGPDSVIATLDELTKKALHARCSLLPGGDGFTPTSNQKTMIDFLMKNAEEKVEKLRPETQSHTSIGVDDMNDDEAKSLIPDEDD